jgi:hypothetical protein
LAGPLEVWVYKPISGVSAQSAGNNEGIQSHTAICAQNAAKIKNEYGM